LVLHEKRVISSFLCNANLAKRWGADEVDTEKIASFDNNQSPTSNGSTAVQCKKT
jgi:hypothetical protein